MPSRAPQPQERQTIGSRLDEWIPRALKLLGLASAGLAAVLAIPGIGEFNQFMFGAGLLAASGGFSLDAWLALRSGRE